MTVLSARKVWSLRHLTLAAAEALAPAIDAVLRSHLDDGPPVIMEGDYLLPALAGRLSGPEVRVAGVLGESAAGYTRPDSPH